MIFAFLAQNECYIYEYAISVPLVTLHKIFINRDVVKYNFDLKNKYKFF